jgi:hypothetical protein
MDNVQNCDGYIIIPSSQTHRQHWPAGLVAETYCVSGEVQTNPQSWDEF